MIQNPLFINRLILQDQHQYNPDLRQLLSQAQAIQSLEREDQPDFENLVFEGGGVKGLCYAGVVEVLEANGVLQKSKRIAGSSAGAITAMLLAMGYNSSEIKDILQNKIDFKKLMDRRSNFDPTRVLEAQGMKIGITDLIMLFKHKGLYKGEAFNELARNLVKTKIESILNNAIQEEYQKQIQELQEHNTSKEVESYIEAKLKEKLDYFKIADIGNITFKQFEEIKNAYPDSGMKSLYVTGTKLSDGSLKVFSAETDPNMSIVQAVRISMSFPFGFEPVLYQGEYYADGGIADNYPVGIFNADQYLSHGLNQAGVNPCTLGFVVDSQEEIEARWGIAKEQKEKNFSLSSFIGGVVGGIHNRWEILRDLYSTQTIQIDDLGVPTMDLELDTPTQERLIDSGRNATQIYFDLYHGKDTTYQQLPDYDSLQEKYFTKGPTELKRIIESEIWPLLDEIHALNVNYDILKQQKQLEKISTALSEYDETEVQVESERIKRIEKLELQYDEIDRRIQTLKKQLNSISSDINLIKQVLNKDIAPELMRNFSVSDTDLSQAEKTQSRLQREIELLEYSIDDIEEQFLEETQDCNKNLAELIIHKKHFEYIEENQVHEYLQQMELTLHSQLDMALNALSSFQRDYPDPRTREDFTKNNTLYLNNEYKRYLNYFQNKKGLHEEQAKHKSELSIHLADILLSLGVSQVDVKFYVARLNNLLEIELSGKKKEDVPDIEHKLLVKTIEDGFFQLYLKNTPLELHYIYSSYFQQQLEKELQVSEDLKQASLKAASMTVEHFQKLYSKEKKIKPDDMLQANFKFAEEMQSVSKKLTTGKWDDHISLPNQADALHNLTNVTEIKGETYNRHETGHHVKTVKSDPKETIRLGLLNKTKKVPPIAANILVPGKVYLQKPEIQPKELIVNFQLPGKSKKEAFGDTHQFAVASMFSQQREKQFSKIKNQLIQQIIWGIREAKENAIPKDSQISLTIYGEGLAGQDAQYLLLALVKELNKSSVEPELESLSNINLILTDPTRPKVSCALELKEEIQKLKEKEKLPKLRGYNLIHQHLVGTNHWRSRSQNYIGDENILGQLSPEEANIYCDYRSKKDPNKQIKLIDNSKEEIIPYLAKNNSRYNSTWYRALYVLSMDIRNISKKIVFNYIGSSAKAIVFVVGAIGSRLIKNISSPFVRLFSKLFKRKKKKVKKTTNWLDKFNPFYKSELDTDISELELDKEEDSTQQVLSLINQGSPSERLKKIAQPPIENLVLEGGGIKGVAYAGALEVMENKNMLENLQRVAGSSAGGIFAALMAVGYNGTEIKDILSNELDFKKLMDEPISLGGLDSLFSASGMDISITGLVSLFKNKGLYQGDKFEDLMQNLINRKLSESIKFHLYKNTSFSEIQTALKSEKALNPELVNKKIDDLLNEKLQQFLKQHEIDDLGKINLAKLKELRETYPDLKILDIILTATNLNTTTLKTFSAESDPELPLYKAIRMTMAFPGGFMPVEYENQYYGDGGIADNLPMQIFDRPQYLTHGLNDAGVNPCTLGILIDSEDEIKSRWGIKVESEEKLSFAGLIGSVVAGMHNRSEILRDKYAINTVQIIDDVGKEGVYEAAATMDLNMSKEKKERLVQNGREALMEYHALYRDKHITYQLVDQYQNLEQKYHNKSVLEIQRIIKTELIPYLLQIREIEPQVKSRIKEIDLEIGNLPEHTDSEAVQTILLKINNKFHELSEVKSTHDKIIKALVACQQELEVTENSLEILQKKKFKQPLTKNEFQLEKKLKDFQIKLKKEIENLSGQYKLKQEQIDQIEQELDGLEAQLSSYDQSIVRNERYREQLEKEEECLNQFQYTHKYLLDEKKIIEKALKLKGVSENNVKQYFQKLEEDEPAVEQRVIDQFDYHKDPIIAFHSKGYPAPIKSVKQYKHFQNLDEFCQTNKLQVEKQGKQLSVINPMNAKENVNVSTSKDQAQFTGTSVKQVLALANEYVNEHEDEEHVVNFELQAKNFSDLLKILKKLSAQGVDLDKITNVTLKNKEPVNIEALKDDLRQDQLFDRGISIHG